MENNREERANFAKLISMTADVYGKELNDALVLIYFKALNEFSISEVNTAFNKHIREERFFPKPVDIIDRINGVDGNLEGRAILQASLVWDSISTVGHAKTVIFKDQTTAAVIENGFGGWCKMCSEMQEREHKWFLKDFVKIYMVYARSGIKCSGKLLGWYDMNNFANGYLGKESEVVLIGHDNEKKYLEIKP